MKILLPVDGSESSMQAARFVAQRFAPDQLQPVLLNVQRPPMQAWPGPGFDHAVLDEALGEQGRAVLGGAEALLSDAGVRTEGLVRIGHPADTILTVAQEHAVDGIVIGTRGKGALGGFALGSAALRVASAADCPVLLVKPDAQLPSGTALRVLAPIDGSDASTEAVRQLARFASAIGPVHVHLVHYQRPLTLIEMVLPSHEDVLRTWIGEASAASMDEAARILTEAGIPHETHSFVGDPDEGIAGFADEIHADLIAMAPHGSGTMRRLAFGSATWKTVQLSRVPVLLMR